jgi:hypothetical protein
MMAMYWIGALTGVLALFWGILRLQQDPLEQTIEQIRLWEGQQAALGRATKRTVRR